MSRIKILLAEEENIDDLKVPVRFGKDFYDSVQEFDTERLAEQLSRACIGKTARDKLMREASYEFDEDDNGDEVCYMENYLDLIGEIVEEELDRLIQAEHIDLTDTEYFKTVDLAKGTVADYYADYESALCDEALEDAKYKLDELRERNGQC